MTEVTLILQLFGVFFVIGLFTFGGGYAMLSFIQTQVVVAHGWLSESAFTDIVAISQMTPGPVGINCATYVGYEVLHQAGASHLAGILGSLSATFAVILPSFIIVLAIVKFYTKFTNSRVFAGDLERNRAADQHCQGELSGSDQLGTFRRCGSGLDGLQGRTDQNYCRRRCPWIAFILITERFSYL